MVVLLAIFFIMVTKTNGALRGVPAEGLRPRVASRNFVSCGQLKLTRRPWRKIIEKYALLAVLLERVGEDFPLHYYTLIYTRNVLHFCYGSGKIFADWHSDIFRDSRAQCSLRR